MIKHDTSISLNADQMAARTLIWEFIFSQKAATTLRY